MSVMIGSMSMPPGFRYAEVFNRGRPRHGIPGQLNTYDAFFAKHPPMEKSRRAKIFAPFDALRGFGEAVAAKQVLYEERRVLTEGEREELDRRMMRLQEAAGRSRRAGESPAPVSITYFRPCEDPESDAFGKKGTYETVTGILKKVDSLHHRIILDNGSVVIEDISEIAWRGSP